MPPTLEEIKKGLDFMTEKAVGVEAKFTAFEEQYKKLETNSKTTEEAITSMREALKVVQKHTVKDDGYTGFFPSADHAKGFGMIYAAIAGHGWAKEWLKGNGEKVGIKAMSEGTSATGGYLTEELYSRTIIRNIDTFGLIAQEASLVPLGAKKMYFPTRAGGFIVYNPEEGADLTKSDLQWDRIMMEATKWAVAFLYSEELDEDSMIALGEWLAFEIPYAFAKKEDEIGINGDGTATSFNITGILASIGAAGKVESENTTVNPTYTDLIKLIGTLPEWADDGNAIFVMHRYIWSLCMGMVDSQKRPIANMLVENGKAQRYLLGYRVRTTPAMSKAPTAGKPLMTFGNIKRTVMLGRRTGLATAKSEHAAFFTDQIAGKATIRQTIKCHDVGDASNAGGIVVLVLKEEEESGS